MHPKPPKSIITLPFYIWVMTVGLIGLFQTTLSTKRSIEGLVKTIDERVITSMCHELYDRLQHAQSLQYHESLEFEMMVKGRERVVEDLGDVLKAFRVYFSNFYYVTYPDGALNGFFHDLETDDILLWSQLNGTDRQLISNCTSYTSCSSTPVRKALSHVHDSPFLKVYRRNRHEIRGDRNMTSFYLQNKLPLYDSSIAMKTFDLPIHAWGASRVKTLCTYVENLTTREKVMGRGERNEN
ncbi:hypothetical protein BC829DRAFT_406940 [Chytridium lagenaria]|nr:hypothetical protein BC829DRAFT_406940 [Chytridium lagenaria]